MILPDHGDFPTASGRTDTRITRVETLPAAIGRRIDVDVKIFTDEGIVGIGEAACSFPERALFGVLEELHRYLIGANPCALQLAEDGSIVDL